MTARFITVEGIEGAGKSSNIAFIKQQLLAANKDIVVTREPGGTPLGEQIRDVLLSHRNDGMAVDTELLLMFAARAEHLACVIRPALDAGQWVLCDRFTEATYAYQGGGRGIPEQRIAALEEWLQGPLRPDLTLLLDVPPALGLERAGRRNVNLDRFESEQLAFFERVRADYLRQAELYRDRYCVIDAAQELSVVQACISQALDGILHA
ncbi:MAG: dTMP kinase [Gammaproteobacteria bacterium]|nr:dTMP kinase [Gammaproteobacteria bacterium]